MHIRSIDCPGGTQGPLCFIILFIIRDDLYIYTEVVHLSLVHSGLDMAYNHFRHYFRHL